jgi:hypothetical protein
MSCYIDKDERWDRQKRISKMYGMGGDRGHPRMTGKVIAK